MRTFERPLGPGERPAQGTSMSARLWHVLALARRELAARFGAAEWVLLVILIAVPIPFVWHFASPSYFFFDDFHYLYWAHNTPPLLSYFFDATYGRDHLAPGFRLAYLVLDRVAPMNFEVALAFLLACRAVSAVLLQRILTLLFGRAWWTFALALAWAISAIYLPGFTWFAAGLHSMTALTATLASIHGYLCWRATARRGWLAWSLVAMCIGLAFYARPLFVPLYLVLMRVLLLDPAAPLRDSLRSLFDEWRVWLAYATVCAVFVLGYLLGDYSQHEQSEAGATVGVLLRHLQVFWVEGLWPMVFGVRVPLDDPSEWHRTAIVGAQVVLIALVWWSVARRRAAWRAWAFLIVAVAANSLMLVERVSQLGAEYTAYTVRYYADPALLIVLAVAFAFAPPRLRARVAPVPHRTPQGPIADGAMSTVSSDTIATRATTFRLPGWRAGAVALVVLAGYVGAVWGAAGGFSSRCCVTPEEYSARSGPYARAYFDNLRADLATVRHSGREFSLLDHDVPEPVVEPQTNLKPAALQAGVRYSRLSSLVPLFGDQVTFNEPGPLHIVEPDGHLQPTRFVPAAGGSHAKLRRTGRLRIDEGRVEHRRGEWCVVAEGLSALEWEPRPHLRGRNWWLRIRYRTDPVERSWLESNAGTGWVYEGPKLPPMGAPGTAIVDLTELGEGVPTSAGVRLGVPPLGRLCVRSLEIGSFEPPPPSPTGEP